MNLIKRVTNFIERIIHRDTWLRLAVVTSGNHEIKTIQEKYNPIIDEIHERIGVNKGIIQEHIIQMSLIGIDDPDVLITSFLYMPNTREYNLFKRIVATGFLSERTLKGLGINEYDSKDLIEFKDMNPNQRGIKLSKMIRGD
jgi:hypothetical protein